MAENNQFVARFQEAGLQQDRVEGRKVCSRFENSHVPTKIHQYYLSFYEYRIGAFTHLTMCKFEIHSASPCANRNFFPSWIWASSSQSSFRRLIGWGARFEGISKTKVIWFCRGSNFHPIQCGIRNTWPLGCSSSLASRLTRSRVLGSTMGGENGGGE